jgi:hypothetical protein
MVVMDARFYISFPLSHTVGGSYGMGSLRVLVAPVEVVKYWWQRCFYFWI